MLLRSTTKPHILEALVKNHISEAFRIDFVTNRCSYDQNKTTNFSIRGRFDQKSFFMRRVIVFPFKFVVTNTFHPRLFFRKLGVDHEGGRSNQKMSFMRG